MVVRKDATGASPTGETVPVLQASWCRRKPGNLADQNNWLQVAFYIRDTAANRWTTLSGAYATVAPSTLKISDLEEMKPAGAPSKYRRLSEEEVAAAPCLRELRRPE